MKTLLLLVGLTIASWASAVEVNIYVTDQNGCEWHISGDISYSLFPPSISSFDVDVSDCHGNSWTFTGEAAPNETAPYDNIDEYVYNVSISQGTATVDDAKYVYGVMINYIQR